jgi:hypothetical protein
MQELHSWRARIVGQSFNPGGDLRLNLLREVGKLILGRLENYN